VNPTRSHTGFHRYIGYVESPLSDPAATNAPADAIVQSDPNHDRCVLKIFNSCINNQSLDVGLQMGDVVRGCIRDCERHDLHLGVARGSETLRHLIGDCSRGRPTDLVNESCNCCSVATHPASNVQRFSRAGRDAMVAQLGRQESSGPRRLQPLS
jgi:hypothetical protein